MNELKLLLVVSERGVTEIERMAHNLLEAKREREMTVRPQTLHNACNLSGSDGRVVRGVEHRWKLGKACVLRH